MFALMILVFVTNRRLLFSHNDIPWSAKGDGSARSSIRHDTRLLQRREEGEPVQIPVEVITLCLPRS